MNYSLFPALRTLLALSSTARLILWIVGAVLVLGLIANIIIMLYVGFQVFKNVLRRPSPTSWGRVRSFDEDYHVRMDDIGMQWYEEFKDQMIPLTMTSHDGLKLCAEYYDFGSDKCVIFLSGRAESLRYVYYFARIYSNLGINLLAIDARAHGWSEGKYNTVGFEEYKDDLDWARLVHDKFGIEHIFYHGICIGAAGGLYACTSPACPPYIDGLIAEGMFPFFGKSMRNNLIVRKKPTVTNLFFNFWLRHYTGHTMYRGPKHVIGKMTKPLLMLHSHADIFSLPQDAEKLYKKCPSEFKRIEWFEDCPHSMLRITHTEQYDRTVGRFLSDLYDRDNMPEAVSGEN